MKIDYDVGDVIVKRVDSPAALAGTIARCAALIDCNDGEGLRLFLEGESSKVIDWQRNFFGWMPEHWKKLPKADDDFTEYMRSMKPHKQPVEARCPLTGQPLTARQQFEMECG